MALPAPESVPPVLVRWAGLAVPAARASVPPARAKVPAPVKDAPLAIVKVLALKLRVAPDATATVAAAEWEPPPESFSVPDWTSSVPVSAPLKRAWISVIPVSRIW